VDVDRIIERLLGDLFLPLVLGLAAAVAYLAVLARAHQKTRTLIAIGLECRRRRIEEERVESRLGYSPRLARLRRLEAEITRRLSR
jgi:hypothetical protein